MKIKKRKKIFALLIVAIITLTTSVPASAATKYGYGFISTPITMYASNSLAEWEVQQLREAMAVWNSQGLGTLFVYGGRASLLSMFWLPDGKNGVIKGQVPGRTGISNTIQNGSKITEGDISLNSLVTYNNGSTISGQYYLKSVFVHELGHILGLNDNYNSLSVMYASYNGLVQPNASDRIDLDSLY